MVQFDNKARLSHARSSRVPRDSLELQSTQRKANVIVTRILRLPNSAPTPCIFDAGEAFFPAPDGVWNVGPMHPSQHRVNKIISPLRPLRLERSRLNGRVGERQISCF